MLDVFKQKQLEKQVAYEELKEAQRNGTQKMIKGNVDSTYEFPENEAHLIHLRLTTRTHNPAKMDYDTHVKIAKHQTSICSLNPDGKWDNKKLMGKTYSNHPSVQILHNPAKPAVKEKAKKDEPKEKVIKPTDTQE